MAAPVDMNVRCDTCGSYTGLDSHCCGQCATDWNDRDPAAGLRRINRRRHENGLGPIEREAVPLPPERGQTYRAGDR